MKNGNRIKHILQAIYHYFTFFLLIAFIITCCTMLFVSTLEKSLNITLTEAELGGAARLTFLNVALLSLVLTVIDYIRRKLTVERPAKSITDAADKIMQGDFSVRVKPQSKLAADANFNQVIECFNKMAEELGSVETLRTDFIANVSHEMKTPLAVIQNYGTLLQSPDISNENRLEYAKGVTDGCRRMADMMTNILRLNRLENQQIFPEAKEFDLGEQICECLLQYENIWEKAQIKIETDIAENIKIKADAELLALIWNNLFSNAFKFTEPGGTVSVRLTADEQCAVVEIKDTGCGMSSKVGSHIFEKFYQEDTSHSAQGNGLGLAIVKRVVDIIHGEIGVESAVGVGTTFTVKIRRT